MSRRTRLVAALAVALTLVAPPALANTDLLGGAGGHKARTSPAIADALATAAPAAPLVTYVSVREGLDAAAVLAGHPGVRVLRNYPLVSAAFVQGATAAIARLATDPSVEYLQEQGTFELADDATSWATRVRNVQEGLPGAPYTDGSGNVLNGAGVGVAVVDGGVNLLHPDLKNRVARNFLHVCATPDQIDPVTETCLGNKMLDDSPVGDGTPRYGWIELPQGHGASDVIGHGTAVAGVIAGEGTQSTGSYAPGTGPNVKGTFTGVAPGTTLYSFNGFALAGVQYELNITDAHYYILSHLGEFNPAIRIVNNSFDETNGGIPFDPSSIRSRLTDALVDAGVVMVYPAGNYGGTGTLDQTSSMCDNPKPGVICVANYDEETIPGDRDGTISPTSSRGLAADSTTATWPDISAPGTFVVVPCIRAIQSQCWASGVVNEARWDGWYHQLDLATGQGAGTSLSAAHVSGALAMLLQASPSLTPAQVEDRIQDNAYKFTFGPIYVSDPQNSGGTTSYDKGAGLLDLKATLDSLGVSHPTATALSSYELIGGDGGDAHRSGADIVSLKVTQATGSSGAAGFRYDLELAGLDFSTIGSATYRLWQTIDGKDYMTSIDVSAFTVNAGIGTFPPVTSPAEDVTISGNVMSFFVPFSKLGNVPAGEPIFRVHVNTGISNQQVCVNFATPGSSCPTTFDTAPGNMMSGLSSSAALHPQYGRPYARV